MKKNVGDQVKIKVYRGGEIIEKTLTLADSTKIINDVDN